MKSLATAVLAFTAGTMAMPSYDSGLGAGGLPRVNMPRAMKRASSDKKGVFMMNRIAPATSDIYVANADGTGEVALLANSSSSFEYHASWSQDGKFVTFSSRNGDGQSDLYKVAITSKNGTVAIAGAPEEIIATPSFEDKLVLSPDGTKGAFVSTANGYTANIWVVD